MVANVLQQQQSQIENLQKQQHRFNRPSPSWFTQRPANVQEPKYYNGKWYYWCEPCGRYSNTHATEAIGDFWGHNHNYRPPRHQDRQHHQQHRHQHQQNQQQQDSTNTASGHNSQASSNNTNRPRSFHAAMQDLDTVKMILCNCVKGQFATQDQTNEQQDTDNSSNL
jgi:hypothetical protein